MTLGLFIGLAMLVVWPACGNTMMTIGPPHQAWPNGPPNRATDVKYFFHHHKTSVNSKAVEGGPSVLLFYQHHLSKINDEKRKRGSCLEMYAWGLLGVTYMSMSF
nr:hypothetical protein Iba_chr11fCG4680 [Ipomoea batatas]